MPETTSSAAAIDDDYSNILSVDDHVVEPPTLWSDRLPERLREIGPRVVRRGISSVRLGAAGALDGDMDDEGVACDWWLYEDLRRPISNVLTAAGHAKDEVGRPTTFDDMRRGCFDADARVKDMALNGVTASLCFPNVLPRFCGQTFLEAKDKELAGLCVGAYNDWMADEWAGPSAGHLIHCSIVPLWDAESAAAEVRRNGERGGRAVSFTELPAALGLPSIHSAERYWDPFFQACDETSTVVCLHIGSSSQSPTTSSDAPRAITAMLLSTNAMASLSDWLFSGLFERFPGLKVAFSEANIGWIPFMLERADRMWHEHQHVYDRAVVPRPPSEYYAEHVYGCYVSDSFGLASIDAVGEDNVTFETDYPHADSTWPNSIDVARRELAALSAEQRDKVLRRNAMRMLGIDELPVLG